MIEIIDQFHVVSVCECPTNYLFYFVSKAYFRDALKLVFCNDKFSEILFALITAACSEALSWSKSQYLGDRTLFYFYLRTNPDFLFTMKY